MFRPYILGVISALVFGYVGDRLKSKAPVIVISQAFLMISYVLQILFAGNVQDHVAVCYFAIFLATTGIYPVAPAVNAWTVNNLAGPMKRAVGIAFMLTMSNAGGIIGSYIFVDSEKPKYPTGFGSSLAFSTASLVSAILLSWVYRYKNKQKAKQSEAEIRDKFSEEELEKLGDKSPLFRYQA